MIWHKMVRVLREGSLELRNLADGRYPYFVTEIRPRPLQEEVPVFMFHRDDPEELEAQFDYLRRNDYRSLRLNEFMDFLSGKTLVSSRAVVLTWDDGDSSWFTEVCPLLKKYGLYGTGFIVPTRITNRPKPSDGRRWLSWDEVRAIEQTGLMDIQSHSLRHDRIFVAPDLIDFFHPGFDINPLHLDIPWRRDRNRYTNQLAPGTPIYRYSSRLSDNPMIRPDPVVGERCASLVRESGGELFFRKPGWRKELIAVYRRETSRGLFYDRETPDEQETEIFKSLCMSRNIISEKLGKDVRHLCYPYGEGGRLSVSLSRQAGYVSNFWVVLSGRQISRPGDSPIYIPRLKNDYVFRLPGKGRKTLAEIFLAKIRRRIRLVHIY